MKRHYSLALLLGAALLTAFGAKAGTITADSSGTIVENFPSTVTGTDARGDTVTGQVRFNTVFFFPGTVTFSFVSPVTELGFEYGSDNEIAQVDSVTLSNGDTFSLPQPVNPTSGYVGLISNLNGGFTSASVSIGGIEGQFSGQIEDFRITPAAVPEPSSVALIAPALLACAAALRLRKR